MAAAAGGAEKNRCLEGIDVAVLAGGLGTRLGGVLGDTPKVLAPIGGRPYLDYLIDRLTAFGARRIVLLLGHLAGPVIAHVKDSPRPGCEIVSVVEVEPMGTAGALRHARGTLNSDPVMVMNGDSFVDADLCKFLKYHNESNAMASILCTEVEDAGRYGRVRLDAGGRVAEFVEKDAAGGGPVNAGVYLFNAAMLDYIALGSGTSLERDVFGTLPEGSLNAYFGRFAFIDIGTPESLEAASAVFRRIAR